MSNNESVGKKIVEALKKQAETMEEPENINFDSDVEYLNICHSRNVLARSLRSIYEGLHSAYLIKKRQDATVSETELKDLLKKATTDGIEEATIINQRLMELDKMVEGIK